MRPQLFAVLVFVGACSDARAQANTQSSSFARYYVKRTSSGADMLTIAAHSPWAYAMVRGADSRAQLLSSISFDAGTDIVYLSVPTSQADSAYEIIVSTSALDEDDPALLPGLQSPVDGTNITLSFTGYEKMDRDPPPPPPANWDFPWSFAPPVAF